MNKQTNQKVTIRDSYLTQARKLPGLAGISLGELTLLCKSYKGLPWPISAAVTLDQCKASQGRIMVNENKLKRKRSIIVIAEDSWLLYLHFLEIAKIHFLLYFYFWLYVLWPFVLLLYFCDSALMIFGVLDFQCGFLVQLVALYDVSQGLVASYQFLVVAFDLFRVFCANCRRNLPKYLQFLPQFLIHHNLQKLLQFSGEEVVLFGTPLTKTDPFATFSRSKILYYVKWFALCRHQYFNELIPPPIYKYLKIEWNTKFAELRAASTLKADKDM